MCARAPECANWLEKPSLLGLVHLAKVNSHQILKPGRPIIHDENATPQIKQTVFRPITKVKCPALSWEYIVNKDEVIAPRPGPRLSRVELTDENTFRHDLNK